MLGPNGAGKSTVLRIMAGLEEPSSGEAQLARGASVGLLSQEPDLDPEKTVRENVEDGVREARDLLDRFNAISARFAEPDADYDTLLAEQAKVQDEIDRATLWELDATLDRAMDALRTAGRRPRRGDALRRRAPPRRARAAAALRARPACCSTSRRTISTRSRSAWLERFLADYKGTVVAVTHDRYFLDNVAGWILELDRGKGLPFEGNYSSWLEQKQARLAIEEKTDLGAPAHARARARVGPHEPARAPREVEGAPRRVREAASPRSRT